MQLQLANMWLLLFRNNILSVYRLSGYSLIFLDSSTKNKSYISYCAVKLFNISAKKRKWSDNFVQYGFTCVTESNGTQRP